MKTEKINVLDMSGKTDAKILDVCLARLELCNEESFTKLFNECEASGDYGAKWRLQALMFKVLYFKTHELFVEQANLYKELKGCYKRATDCFKKGGKRQ